RRGQVMSSIWVLRQQKEDSGKQRRYVAFHDTPDYLGIKAIVVVDKDVARRDHLSPRNLGMRSAKLSADFARRFANNFQVSANSVHQERIGHVTLMSKLATLTRLKAGIANV